MSSPSTRRLPPRSGYRLPTIPAAVPPIASPPTGRCRSSAPRHRRPPSTRSMAVRRGWRRSLPSRASTACSFGKRTRRGMSLRRRASSSPSGRRSYSCRWRRECRPAERRERSSGPARSTPGSLTWLPGRLSAPWAPGALVRAFASSSSPPMGSLSSRPPIHRRPASGRSFNRCAYRPPANTRSV